MSARVMNTLKSYSPATEVYSIDEAFLDFTGMEGFDFEKLGRDIIRPPARNRHPDLSGHRPDESTGQGRQQARQDGRRPAGALYYRHGRKARGGIEKTTDRRCVGHRAAL